MNEIVKSVFFLLMFMCIHAANGQTFYASSDQKIRAKISKSGLNRIASPPYQITQVTGDESKYHLKFDEDGANIYLIPLVAPGEKIEISIKNSGGLVHDLELEVASMRGQTINVTPHNLQREAIDWQVVSEMLKAMRSGKHDKFYVQDTYFIQAGLEGLEVIQTELFKWKDLNGGVFLVLNKTTQSQALNLTSFLKAFSNPVASYLDKKILAPKETGKIFIIQKIRGKE